MNYPKTMTVQQVDLHHGVKVSDPWRWLEQDVRESADVRDWVERQNRLTFDYLGGIGERERIRARLEQLWDYERYGLPVKEGGRYFYAYNDGLQNQDVVHVLDALHGQPRVLLDPNAWSQDGTVALAGWYPSPDGRHLAYLVQDGGSDWRSAGVMRTETGEVLPDRLDWLKFTGLAWAADGSGFYYSRYPETASGERFQSLNRNHAVYFHRLGSAQNEDTHVYSSPEHPDWGYAAAVTDDGRYLVVTVWLGTDNRHQVVVKDLEQEGAEPWMLIEGFDFDYSLAGAAGDTLYFRTDNDAPRGRLIAIDLERPEPAAWREIVPEADDVLEGASLIGGRIVARYMRDAHSVVRLFGPDGSAAGEVELPGLGSANGFGGRVDDPETFFVYSSFDTPGTIRRLDVATGETEVFRRPKTAFDGDDYAVRQVFYRSADGTRVPMFIAHRKDVTPDGDRPTLLYGYGGFNVSLTPAFSITRLAWMEMGGIYAVANLRGGGEYGKAWHEAGKKLNKQNVFDDFVAAAEYLADQGYTRPGRLAIMGGSNGGLLVGAVLNQRPELFGAALPAVGVMDMLRFHLFTAGRFWVDDYGSAEDPAEFAALYAYSPYHNVRPGTHYPAVLVSTADTDDRVVPGHSFKYAAALQAAQAGDAPVLIRIETRAGHGAGTPTQKLIEEYADYWAFLVRNLGMRLPENYAGAERKGHASNE